MKDLIKDNWIELLLILIAFASLFISAIPAVPFAALCLLLIFIRLDVLGIILLCIYAVPKLAGAICLVFGIPGVGGALILLAPALVIYNCFITKKYKLSNINKSTTGFLLLFTYLFFSVAFLGIDWSWMKLLYTIINGVVAFFVYAAVFSNYQKCNFIRTGLYFILIAFLLLLLSPIFNNGSGPSGLLDFGYLRIQNIEFGDDEIEGIIAYQQVGFVAVLGFGTIILEELKGKINMAFLFVTLLLSSFASFYAGARQFIVVSVMLVVVWSVFEKRGAATKIFVPLIVGVFLFFILKLLLSSEGMLNSVVTDGYLEASKRGDRIEEGIDGFHSSPLYGIGYGCYKHNGATGGYPHNLFVEILCELGILGLLVFWIPLFRPTWSVIKKMRPCIYIFIVYFMRSMASGGLDTNIYIFSYILATYSCFSYGQNNQLINKQNEIQ